MLARRIWCGTLFLLVGMLMHSTAPAQEKKKASAVSGKITEVFKDSTGKKIESISIEFRKNFARGVRMDEKTKIEFPANTADADKELRAGMVVAVQYQPESDVAALIRVTAPAKKKK